MIETLYFGGEWTLKFRFFGEFKWLEIVRYSHDEPMGAMFKVSKSDSDTCEYCGDIAECKK